MGEQKWTGIGWSLPEGLAREERAVVAGG